jgi:hypothetical protein
MSIGLVQLQHTFGMMPVSGAPAFAKLKTGLGRNA